MGRLWMGNMSIEPTIKIDGQSRVISMLNKASDIVKNNVPKALDRVVYLLQRESRRRAPYRDGDLERSIEYKTGRNYVDIMVPMNSPAGRYAKVMHDGEYKLGEKSRRKGGDIGRLYIKRAISDNIDQVKQEFQMIFRGIN